MNRIVLSIIVPVYNEASNVEQVIDAIGKVVLPNGVKKELIVIDDGSTDGTTETLKRIEHQKQDVTLKIHSSVLNFGKGTAIRIGLKYASGDIIIIQDGDLEYDPNDYGKIIQPIIDEKAEVVYGTRFACRPKGMKFKYYLANRILTFVANLLFSANITDEATAYKAFSKNVIKNISLNCKRFEFCPEILAKVRKKGFNIVEVPISYDARSVSDGKKIKWSDGFVALWTLVKYRVVN